MKQSELSVRVNRKNANPPLRQQLKHLENCAQRNDSRLTMKSQLIAIVAAVLLVGCGPSAPDISIHKAALDGNIVAIKQHLAAGTDVNAKDDDDETPLHGAALSDHKEIVELLIANDADVNAKGYEGNTPLHTVAGHSTKEMTELLITNGADVNAKGSGDWTPLHWAVDKDRKEVVELLIAKGADVNVKNDGAEWDAKNKDGDTPLDVMQIAGGLLDTSKAKASKKEVAALLRKHGGKTGEELKSAGN